MSTGQADLTATLGHFWHPVATVDEIAGDQPLAVTLLGRELAVARLADGSYTALDDRCLHRSARLSVGTVEGCDVRCAYHGWTWAADGQCTSIPSMPDTPIPRKAKINSFPVHERFGLVWVRLIDHPTPAPFPICTAWGDESLHTLVGEPYVWPVAAGRRAENFFDLAHFAWVHDGSLGSRDDPVPPLPTIDKSDFRLLFTYEMPDFEPSSSAMYGRSLYRVSMPCAVEIEFQLATGARRILWMVASPIDESTCRSFWLMSRDDDLDGDDAEHMRFQQQILGEDEPIVGSQTPGAFPLDPSSELSVHTDVVSNTYRRWIRELVRTYADGGSDALMAAATGRGGPDAGRERTMGTVGDMAVSDR